MADLRYLVRRADGATYGPYAASALREFAAKGTISPRDYVRPEHGTRWELARRAGCLAGAVWPGEGAADAAAGEDAADVTASEGAAGASASEGATGASASEAAAEPARAAPAETASAGTGSPEASSAAPIDADSQAQALLDLHDRLRAARLPITVSADETVLVLRSQTLLDVAARSVVAALLGRRGTLVATSQRIAATVPGLLGEESIVIDMERISSVRIGRRIGIRRAFVGAMLLLNGLAAWVASSLLGMAGYAISSVDMGAGYGDGMSSAAQVVQWLGGGLALMGALALFASLRRSVCIDAGSTRLTFACGRAGTRDVAAISDAMRRQRGPWRG